MNMGHRTAVGHRRWVIAEGYVPEPGPHADIEKLRSHETACILNAGDQDARIRLTIFFHDREPAGPFFISIPARRTRHIRFHELQAPERIPRETEYSSLFESDQPVVIQHSRLDGRLGGIALMTTMAYGCD